MLSTSIKHPDSASDEVEHLRGLVSALERELQAFRGRSLTYDEVRLRRLHHLASDKVLSFSDKIQKLLAMGLETFGLKVALISRVQDGVYTVLYSLSMLDPIPVGTEFSLSNTYCSTTLGADRPTAFHYVAHSEIREHPCYRNFGLEAYIGAVVWVSGERFGTLNFSSPDPVRPFVERDLVMIKLFAQWVGYEMEREQRIIELDAARTRAEAATAARSRFLATMSHELRAPLSGVLNVLGVLGNTALDEEQRRYHGLLTRTSGIMLTMLNDLLDMAKIEAGQLTLEVIPFCFRELLEDVEALTRPAAEQKGVSLQISCPLDHQRLGDPTRLRQVILNLVNNAVKFTPSGQITISAREQGPQVEVRVIDTGIGMTREQRARLFKPFLQADATIQRRFGGTGLGLTICKQLIEAMGGEIDVHSVEGEGSTFWFRVPLPHAPTSHVLLEPVPGRKVLIADDSIINRFLSQRLLEAAGYVPLLAEDGEEALRMAEEHRPDVTLLDLQMPRVDGFTAARLLRARFGSSMALVCISGSEISSTDPQLISAGFQDCVTKPFEPRRLIQAIEACCRDCAR